MSSPRTLRPLYPQVYVNVSGGSLDINELTGHVARVLRNSGVPEERVEQFQKEAFATSTAVATIVRWVTVS